MNINFGLFPPAEPNLKRKDRRLFLSRRALADLEGWLEPTQDVADKRSISAAEG